MFRVQLELGDGDNMPPPKKLKITFGPRETPEPPTVNNAERMPAAEAESFDWRVEHWRRRLAYAQNNNLLCDVIFEVEGQELRAHKLLLAMASPVFEAMFYGVIAEKGDRVVITDLTAVGFKALLEYIYTNEIVLSSIDEAFQLWVAADKYCVPHVKAECSFYFASCQITADVVWATLQTALFLDIEVVAKKCFSYLEQWADVVMITSDFEKLSIAAMISFLSLESLNASELDLMRGLIKWGQARIREQPEMSLKKAVEPGLKLIRFGAMTIDDFCQVLDSSDESRKAFSDGDALAILKHLTKPDVYPLPEWCCKTPWKRCRKVSSKKPNLPRRSRESGRAGPSWESGGAGPSWESGEAGPSQQEEVPGLEEIADKVIRKTECLMAPSSVSISSLSSSSTETSSSSSSSSSSEESEESVESAGPVRRGNTPARRKRRSLFNHGSRSPSRPIHQLSK